MANGFGYQVDQVQPIAGQVVAQGLSGLSNTIQDVMRQRQAQAAQQAAQAEVQAAYESGDPDAVAKAMIKYPEMQKQLDTAIGFRSEATKRNFLDTTRSVLANRENPQAALQALESRAQMVQQAGGDPSDTLEAAQELSQAIQSGNTDQFYNSAELAYAQAADPQEWKAYQSQRGMGGADSGVQFGAQQTLKDEAGNLFFATTRRNPNTGAVESVTASIDGTDKKPSGKLSIAGGYGLTAEERVQQVAAEGGADARAKAMETVRQDYIKQGTAAKPLLRQTQRMLELNEQIRTGKTAGLQKAMGDLFGVTDPDIGEFNSLAGNLVLGSIRQLGANPTEGERAYLSEIMPSIQQSGEVNEAILKNLAEIQERQIERARWLVKNPGKSIEEYLLIDDDFTPERSAQGQPSGAQATTGSAPAAAIDYLRQNPQFKEQFRVKYGYIPEGI